MEFYFIFLSLSFRRTWMTETKKRHVSFSFAHMKYTYIYRVQSFEKVSMSYRKSRLIGLKLGEIFDDAMTRKMIC